jgi:HK97 gp10 family phage protein
MITVKVEWRAKHFAEVRRKLPHIARAVSDKHTDAAVDLMKQLAPVRTGHLRDSIHKVEDSPSGGLIASKGIQIEAYYWIFVEYGTVYMEAQPFVHPALQAVKSRFQIETANIVRRELAFAGLR